MAQIASIASLALAGAAMQSQVKNRKLEARAREAQQQYLASQQAAQQRARQDILARSIAATRARFAAGGVSPDEGSAAALVSGMRADAAQTDSESADLLRLRLAAGRPSLLNANGEFQGFVRATQSFGAIARNLLD
ncbi:MAG: hypothetical protein INF75_16170 [Roseomonas sp.]|nr:hypothetical protein [Roseomonas sp.]MCA3326693.1 hypothetical protein [Roseomonas sp.]MCA3332390.1 hypothetical protein [Roseomonas sp.]MCA3336748.1 hypothetical protein [Roseomonas sp.]MCA3345678.1 hypothetical protein [Roseomonas sp.]